MNSSIALGCSHTYGVGVEPDQTWPSLLGLTNLGKPGCSTDYCARILDEYLKNNIVDDVYILYPNKNRFEYIENNQIYQSLPTDKNRINFMESHNDDWCEKNYLIQTSKIIGLCKKYNCLLIDLEFADLTYIIDHNDKWPMGTDNSHFGPQWHKWIADLFTVRKSFKEYAKTR
jgi:hypothetical protein